MVLLLLPFTLLLGVNAFINLGLPLLLNMQPERVKITYEVAWMIQPFQVEVRQLRIRATSPNDQLLVEVDRASAAIDVATLFDRTFSANTIKAHGATFRYRFREDAPVPVKPAEAPIELPPAVAAMVVPVPPVDSDAATPEAGAAAAADSSAPGAEGVDAGPKAPEVVVVSRTPPIDGLSNPPVPRPEDIYPPPGDFWTIILTDVAIEGVREIWMDEYRFVGESRITTTEFRLTPTQFVSTRGTVLEIRDGQVLTGADPLLIGLHGKVTVGLDGLEPKKHPGRTVFGFLSAQATLDASVKNLVFLEHYLRNAPWLALRGGTGDLHVDLNMNNGAFQVGSVLTAGVKDIAARFLSYSVVGDGAVRFEVATQEDGAPESRLGIAFDDFAISRDGDATPHVQGKGFSVYARTDDVALDAPFTDLDVALVIPPSEARDVGVFNAYLPTDIGLAIVSGTASVRGRLDVSTVDNIGRGEMFLSGKNIRATLDDLTIVGDVNLHAVVPEGRLNDGRYDISGSRFELRNVDISDKTYRRRGKDASQGWWATFTLPEGHAASGAPVFLDASLTVKLRDTVPFITVFAQKEPLPGFVRGLLDIKGVSGEATVRLGDTVLHIPKFDVRGGKNFALSMQLRRKQLLYFGKLYLQYGVLSAGMELRGETSKFHLFDARKWYEAEPDVQ